MWRSSTGAPLLFDRFGIITEKARVAVTKLFKGRSAAKDGLPTLDAAVVAKVASKLGCSVTPIESKPVFLEKSAKRKTKRKYVRHLVRAGEPVDRDIMVFTKTGLQAANEAVEHYISETRLPEFRAPIYYGRAATEEGDTGIWEYIPGDLPLLHRCTGDELRRIAQAVGAINTLTADVTHRVPNIPVDTMRSAPVAEQLRATLIDEGELLRRDPTLLSALDHFATLEKGALARLAAIGNRFFSHQDIASGNVLLPPAPDPVAILDWESAAIAAPGVGLRRFATFNMKIQQAVAEHYVAYLQTKGISLEVGDVLFVMGTVQVMNSLHNGANRLVDAPTTAEKAISWGLAHAPDYLRRG